MAYGEILVLVVVLDFVARRGLMIIALGVDPEVFMDSTQLITSKGYPCENHYVTTQDGFILNMQRIPYGRNDKSKQGVKPVVILQHGLEGSSSNYLDNLANQSLAYILADCGADVWLGNSRGNSYSRNHTKLNPKQRAFWIWSWDEMATYDLPAMFDHVTKTTGQQKVHYVGHSQGTMIAFAGFGTNQTLASMVKRFYALAPVARVGHISGPIRKFVPFVNNIATFFELFGHGEFLPHNKAIMDFLAEDVCVHLGAYLCENILFVLAGVDRGHLNISRIPVFVAHNPAGTSVRNMQHFAQGVSTNTFRMFDYGSASANMEHYHQPTPPLYYPENVTVPVISYSGGNDILADPTDVQWLLERLPFLEASIFLPTWEHLDFIWAFDAPKYVYNNIVKHVCMKPQE